MAFMMRGLAFTACVSAFGFPAIHQRDSRQRSDHAILRTGILPLISIVFYERIYDTIILNILRCERRKKTAKRHPEAVANRASSAGWFNFSG